MAGLSGRSSRSVLFVLVTTILSLLLYTAFILRPSHIHLSPQISSDESSTPKITQLPGQSLNHAPPATASVAESIPNKSDTSNTTTQNLSTNTQGTTTASSLAAATTAAVATGRPSHWQFNSTRDERAYGLTIEQCNSAFPDLYTEIDRAFEYRGDIGPIGPEDVNISWAKDGLVRALIMDQQVPYHSLLFSSNSRDSQLGSYTSSKKPFQGTNAILLVLSPSCMPFIVP